MKTIVESSSHNTCVTILNNDPPPLEPIGVGIPQLRGLQRMTAIEIDKQTQELHCTVLNEHFEETQQVREYHFRQPQKVFCIIPADPQAPKEDAPLKIRLRSVNQEKKMQKAKKK